MIRKEQEIFFCNRVIPIRKITLHFHIMMDGLTLLVGEAPVCVRRILLMNEVIDAFCVSVDAHFSLPQPRLEASCSVVLGSKMWFFSFVTCKTFGTIPSHEAHSFFVFDCRVIILFRKRHKHM